MNMIKKIIGKIIPLKIKKQLVNFKILAYMIMAGTEKKPEYLKFARESAAFYNAWFLDHDTGAVYFNVLSNGLPYLLGTERQKGSHSMSGYHSFELAYLAAVYNNLLITKQHMDFHFKPYPNSFEGNKLFVAPDILPQGSIKIETVWINGKEYSDFDAEKLVVNLPETDERVKVKVRIAPVIGDVEHFVISHSSQDGKEIFTCAGELDHVALTSFRKAMSDNLTNQSENVVFDLSQLKTMNSEAVRSIIFEKQKLDIDVTLTIVGANETIKKLFDRDELSEELTLVDSL